MNTLSKKEQMRIERLRRYTSVEREESASPTAGAQPGNSFALKHGVFACKFLDAEEKAIFDALMVKLRADFRFNESSDFMQLELAGLYFLQLARAHATGDQQLICQIDQLFRNHLKDLKVTKIAREGDEPRGPESSPAEWASSLLQQWNEAQKSKRRRKPKNAQTTSDNTAEG